jgi:hypothetical protein
VVGPNLILLVDREIAIHSAIESRDDPRDDLLAPLVREVFEDSIDLLLRL